MVHKHQNIKISAKDNKSNNVGDQLDTRLGDQQQAGETVESSNESSNCPILNRSDCIKKDDDTLESLLNVLYKTRHQAPNQTGVKVLTQIHDYIRKTSNNYTEHTIEIMLIIQDIVKNCFEDNEHGVKSFYLCKDIIDSMVNASRKEQPPKLATNNFDPTRKYGKPIVSNLPSIAEPINQFTCNIEDPNAITLDFQLLDENTNGFHADTPECPLEPLNIKYVHRMLSDIVAQYRCKWEKEKLQGYPKLKGGSNVGKKLAKTLPKYEDYILKTLENRWCKFEKKMDKVRDKTDILESLKPIYKLFKKIQDSLGISTPYEQEKPNNGHEYTVTNDSVYLGMNDHMSMESNYLTSMENIKNLNNIIDCNEPIVDHCSVKDSIKNLFTNENYNTVSKTESKNEITLHQNLNIFPTYELANKKAFKEFEIEFNSGVINKPSERVISIQNNQECYINFSKIWNLNSRWLGLKYKLLQKGILKSNGLYLSLPIYRNEFIVAKGTFGNVEVGFSKNFHAVAIKRLTEFGIGAERCADLIKTVEDLCKISHTNLLKSIAIQDICGHTFFYTKLCDYNLADYLLQMKKRKSWDEILIKRISFQIVKGLSALHLYNPSIVHGNLKPANVLIDEEGVLKLAEFGIYKHLYTNPENITQMNQIWWPSEVHMWYKFMKSYNCTTMSDIQACGILLHYVCSGGNHPYGRTNEEIIHNLQLRQPHISVNTLDIWGLLNQMFHPDPMQRPTIAEVVNHVYFWCDEKKWEFLRTCISTANTDFAPFIVDRQMANSFCTTLEESWAKDAIKFFWMASAFVHFPGIEIPYGVWTDSALGLLKFLNKCKNDNPALFNQPGWVLKAYPELPLLIYNALKGSNWFQHDEFKQFSPFAINRD